jgi:uncharacterized protein
MRPAALRMSAALRAGVVQVLLVPVRLWRATVLLRQPRCRFAPSCSTYAVTALRVHGPLRGSWLAARRLLRCHPWNLGGIDHVPPARPVPSASLPHDHSSHTDRRHDRNAA